MSRTLERYTGSVMNTFGPPKLVLARGRAPTSGTPTASATSTCSAASPSTPSATPTRRWSGAVTDQLSTLGHVSNFFTTAPQVELAERLLAAARPRSGRVFFTNSGAEANEAAFKLTRRTGRTHLVAAEGAFHGRTMGALALTAKAAYREPFEPLPGDVTFVPYGDVAALAAAVTDETAAVVLEPIQGEAGVVVPPEGYLAAARRVTSRARRAAVARRGADRHRAAPAPGSPTPRAASSPTSSPWPRGSAAASRSAPASASATPARC